MLASFVGFKRSPERDPAGLQPRPAGRPRSSACRCSCCAPRCKLSDASARVRAVRPGRRRRGEPGCRRRARPGPRPQAATPPWCACYPADGQPRALWVGAGRRAARLPAPALDPALWHWGEVRSGVATRRAPPIVEAFVPQMLNYESVGGVNFKKGCYPGQEVVARSQFRGTLKRRAFLAHARCRAAAPGRRCSSAADPEQPAAWWPRRRPRPAAAGTPSCRCSCAAVEAGGLHAGRADGAGAAAAAPALPAAGRRLRRRRRGASWRGTGAALPQSGRVPAWPA